MAYVLVVLNGMVVTVVGPFDSRKEAEAWQTGEGIKVAIAIPIIYPGLNSSLDPL